MNEEGLLNALLANDQLVLIFKIIEQLALSDCWLCAGTIRNFIWNHLSGRTGMDHLNDVDVIFFDPALSYEETVNLETQLKEEHPEFRWELKNERYMHLHNPKTAPYENCYDAVSKFPDTCTAIAVRMEKGKLELIAPHGVDDLVNFVVRPTPHFMEHDARKKIYQERVSKKEWQKIWPQLTVEEVEKKSGGLL
ncbi:nucleotidyltransferase family protein [Enterococcus gilvus]|uniref:nucleotidyltransferase family protein n=1 Tax=Enterococcus gilvus TaxID=160453 RepID=UPI00345E750F